MRIDMNKKTLFRAALTVMCAIALSVCLNSCDKNEDTPYQEETPYSFRADTNGVGITVVPFLKWGCDISEIKEYVAQYYPDWVAKNDGKLYLDACDGCWTLKYYENGTDSSYVWFDFVGENGNTFNMTGLRFNKSGDIKKIRDEIERLGFKYEGLLYWEDYPNELTYMYLSADKKLEVQLYSNNDESEPYWGMSFQPTDKDDYNHLIDETVISINITSNEKSYTLTPFTDWDATFEDVKVFMAQNYPDWENDSDGNLERDTVRDDDYQWYIAYTCDSLGTCFGFKDAQGKEYGLLQYIDYSSTDVDQLKSELTRHGLIYRGQKKNMLKGQVDGYFYASSDNSLLVEISLWNNEYDCWSMDVMPFDREYYNSCIGH